MLNAELIQKLGQKNVSKNADLTKQRTQELLKAASRKDKNAIDELTDLKRVSLNRVYKTGAISAKIAVSIAQVLDVDPFYLTGESDERGKCSDKNVREFLTGNGFGNLLEEEPKPARSTRTKKDAETPAAPVEPEMDTEQEPIVDSSVELTEEESSQLLRSLYIQAKHSAGAQYALEKVKGYLVYGANPDVSRNTGTDNASTSVVLHNDATKQDGTDLYIRAELWWGWSKISTAYAHSGGDAKLGSEYVWYDLYVYDADSGAELAKSIGVYGSSGWHLVNSGSGYKIQK